MNYNERGWETLKYSKLTSKLSFSSKSKFLASSNLDGSINIYNGKNGTYLVTLFAFGILNWINLSIDQKKYIASNKGNNQIFVNEPLNYPAQKNGSHNFNFIKLSESRYKYDPNYIKGLLEKGEPRNRPPVKPMIKR